MPTCLGSTLPSVFPHLYWVFTCWPQRTSTQAELHSCADKDAHRVILQLQRP